MPRGWWLGVINVWRVVAWSVEGLTNGSLEATKQSIIFALEVPEAWKPQKLVGLLEFGLL